LVIFSTTTDTPWPGPFERHGDAVRERPPGWRGCRDERNPDPTGQPGGANEGLAGLGLPNAAVEDRVKSYDADTLLFC
jgi:hypothetical protein